METGSTRKRLDLLLDGILYLMKVKKEMGAIVPIANLMQPAWGLSKVRRFGTPKHKRYLGGYPRF